MTFSNFLSKLNWRLMLVHLMACWLLDHAFWQFGFLFDYNFLELITHHSFKDLKTLYKGSEPIGVRLSADLIHAALFGFVGLIIGFFISLLISLKQKWHWINPVIVLFLALTISFLHRFYWNHIKIIFMFPGSFFKSDWAYDLSGAAFMLAIGLSLFFWKRIIRFISGAKTHPAETA